MKDEYGGKIIKELIGLRGRTYSYLTDAMIKMKKQNARKGVSS